jgi:hypothetical protein
MDSGFHRGYTTAFLDAISTGLCSQPASRLLCGLDHCGFSPVHSLFAYTKSRVGVQVLPLLCYAKVWISCLQVGGVKGIVRRPRPIYNKESNFILSKHVAVDKFSFPSGHSSRCDSCKHRCGCCRLCGVGEFQLLTPVACRAMFVASFACIALAEFPVAVVLLSFWGASTAFSRALLGRHYVGDVLAGIAIGPLITAIITKVR